MDIANYHPIQSRKLRSMDRPLGQSKTNRRGIKRVDGVGKKISDSVDPSTSGHCNMVH